MTSQARGKAGLIAAAQVDQGAESVRQALGQLAAQGINYVVTDVLHQEHLLTLGRSTERSAAGHRRFRAGHPVLARQWAAAQSDAKAEQAGRPQGDRAVVLSGSCSQMTNRQVAAYRQLAPACEVETERCLDDAGGLCPAVYATGWKRTAIRRWHPAVCHR
ncbi:Uncharacterized protein conserved in bacteria [Pantoea agglomerans]|uniref:Uncharacterized protein conserved in bacteria n=1 Tax=Enterobacter agglomerans TaxID=549 RepID=A0A379ADY4_ENTAG|nr:Uncharacterized protein conserved in bacteria [Pantoea agglomerans]